MTLSRRLDFHVSVARKRDGNIEFHVSIVFKKYGNVPFRPVSWRTIRPELIPAEHDVTRSIATPPRQDASPLQGYPSSKFAWVERNTARVKSVAQGHNAVPQAGLKPGPQRTRIQRPNHSKVMV